MKKILLIVGAVVVLGAIVAASAVKQRSAQRGEKVYLEAAERRAIHEIVKASGGIDPRVKVNISAHVIGKIEKLYVEEGDEIEAGKPFLELEREAFHAAHERARAQLEIARSQVSQAEIDLADTELKLKRYRRLVEEGVSPNEQLEAAELQERSARLRLDQSREAVRQAEADLEKAADDLSKVTIYAPLSGRVIALNAEEGEVVVSGTMNNPASVIGTIADLSEILVKVDVDENEIVDVELGQTATVRVDAIPEHEASGRVVEIGSSGYTLTGQGDVTFFKVEILLDELDPRLRPGMSARAEIEVAESDDTLVVPIQAVVYRPPGDGDEEVDKDEEIRVVFVMEENEAVKRPVEVGLSDETHVEILSGLDEGEQVITGPYRMLRDLEAGDAVQPKDDEDEDEDGEEDEDA